MSPRSLAAVAAVLSRVDPEQARTVAQTALDSTSAQEAREVVRAALPVLEELGL